MRIRFVSFQIHEFQSVTVFQIEEMIKTQVKSLEISKNLNFNCEQKRTDVLCFAHAIHLGFFSVQTANTIFKLVANHMVDKIGCDKDLTTSMFPEATTRVEQVFHDANDGTKLEWHAKESWVRVRNVNCKKRFNVRNAGRNGNKRKRNQMWFETIPNFIGTGRIGRTEND